MNPSRTRVIFMGSPDFAVPSLEALVEAGHNVVQAVTQPDRRTGRGGKVRSNPVKTAALAQGISVFQPDDFRSDEAVAALSAVAPDVIVVAAYGKILPRRVIALPARGILNVHASLLPRWRGPSPIVSAVLEGDATTGVSIMEIAPKMDTGPVVSQRRVPIDDAVTAGELEERLAREGASELINVLPGWFDGEMPAKPQDEAQATYCSLLSKRDGLLKSAMTVEAAARAVRAFNPWPGAFVTYAGERLAIWQAHSSGLPDDLVPGTLETRDRLPYLALGNGWLILDEVQRPGGRRVSGEAFINGLRGDLQLAVELGP